MTYIPASLRVGGYTIDINQRRPSPDMAPSLRPISAIVAAELDRLADLNLQLGYHLRAEYLAQQAFALREDGR